MSRITTTIFIAMLLLNGSATIMASSGLNDDLGVELAPGISDTAESAVEDLRDAFDPSRGLGSTLFSMFLAGLGVIEIVVRSLGALPTMLTNLLPPYIVLPLITPLYAISVFELVYVATGRDLV
jgi:hypothetical protein